MGISTDTTQLAIAPEAVPGVAPDPALFELLRVTGEDVQANANTVESAELNVLRGVTDSILTNINPSGPVNFELSKNTAFEALLEAFMGTDWTANVLTTGALIKTFTYEKRILTDPVAPANDYLRFLGALVDQFSLSITPGAPITGAFEFIGRTTGTAAAELPNTTYNPAGTNPVMRGPLVDQLNLNGAAITDCVQNVNLTGTNNARGIECLGVLGFDDQVLGKQSFEIELQQLYSSRAFYDSFLAQAPGNFQIRCRDAVGGNSYLFEFPRTKASAVSVPIAGTGQDVIYNATLRALLDEGATNTVARITRAP